MNASSSSAASAWPASTVPRRRNAEAQAEMAEQKAKMAEAEAQRERAEAELREQRAQMHERGMADHELIDESERDRFAGTSAVPDERDGDDAATSGARDRRPRRCATTRRRRP